MRKKMAVVGVGNILMGDEGVGVEVMKELGKKVRSDEVEFIEAGTAFFSIVSSLSAFEKLIIIDAVSGAGDAGAMYRFGYEDLTAPQGETLSLHDFGVYESIAMERLRGSFTDQIVIFGIEPERVRLELGLSPLLRERMGVYVEMILSEIRESGVHAAV